MTQRDFEMYLKTLGYRQAEFGPWFVRDSDPGRYEGGIVDRKTLRIDRAATIDHLRRVKRQAERAVSR